jgi:hypothetical protein
MFVNRKAVLLIIVRLPPWLPAILTADTKLQLISGGVVMKIMSVAMMRLVIVVLIVKSKVMPEILTLVALSMVSPPVI